MTKREALEAFNLDIVPSIVALYGKDDKPAFCENWNNYTDTLCKDRRITLKQYETWTNPF